MRKLLLFTFTVALLSMLSVNTFAQWGKTVEVANDEELSVAMADNLIETMLLAPGNYSLLPIEAGQDSKVIKAQAGDRATCLYFIQTQSVCIGLPIPIVAFTNGADECPTSGIWTLESSPLGSTVVIASAPDEITTASADLPGRYVFRYTWDNNNYVEGDYYVIEKPLLEVSEVDPLCEEEGVCFDFVVTLTRDFNLPPQAQALPPYDLTYEIDGGGVVAFQILAADMIAPGVYQKTLEFCDFECGNYEFVFTYLQANNNSCGGDEVTRDVEIYSIPVIDIQADDEICGLVYDLEASFTLDCPLPSVAVWAQVSGPGTSTFDGNEVTVTVCGDYTFMYTVTNGPCSAASSVNISFYDYPEITIQDDDEVCGLEYDLVVSYNVDCPFPGLMAGWNLISGPATTVIFTGNHVEVPECGVYTFEYYVDNGPCDAASQVTISFYDIPEADAGDDAEVCGLEYELMPSYTVDCEHLGLTEGWSLLSGPGTATFTDNMVEVSLCGVYEFLYSVTNGPCGPATDVVVIGFYDEPVVDAGPDQEVCGVSTVLEASWTADCAHPDSYGVWTVKTPGPCAVVFEDENDPETLVTVGCCGEYELLWTVYNNDCEPVSDPVVIKFYDTPEVFAGMNDEICGLVYELMPEVDVECEHPSYLAEWDLVTGPLGATADFNGDVVTVSECGEYEFIYTVTNGPCLPVTSTVTINFYDIPMVYAGEDDEVCGLVYELEGIATVTCEHPDFETGWYLVSGPGTAEFENGTVTVSVCGVYTFRFWASNGFENCYADDDVTIGFFDEPVVIAYAPEVVCGYETDVIVCTTVECEDPNGLVGTWTVMLNGNDVTANVSIIAQQAVQDCEYFAIAVEECGEFEFTYTVNNGDVCTTVTTFTINFYEEPKPTIVGDPAVLCAEIEYTVIDGRTCGFGDIEYTWSITGGVITEDNGTSVKVIWNGPGELCVFASLVDFELSQGCYGEACIEVDPAAPIFAGQVKYWNQFETFMPTPYPTIEYSTYPHDYFYVELWNGEEYLAVTKVEPTIKEVEVGEFEWETKEFMSYFEFDLEDFIADFGCDGYWLKIWDGGLYYHYAFPGGSGVPPVSGTHLGANYTYNNWGGVNATDALAVQMMATAIDINGAPYNYNWVGPVADSPRYGYYSHSAADVNSSNPYTNGGITALDALTTNYRAVGLIDVFPNSQPGVQYSPNFRVTGRMVPDLTYTMTDPGFNVTNVVTNTWPMPFDYDNVDDVPFTYPTTSQSYLYFTNALLHKYSSEEISLSDKNYIFIYYLALGDVNSSYVPTSGGFKAESEMALVYNGEQVVSKGQIVEVPIRVDRNAEVGALSLVLSYNTSLIEVIGVNYDEDFFMVDAETGTIRVMWYNLDQPANFAFGDAIATIQVRVLADIKANARFFELEANTELADRNAQPIKNISLETTALSTISDGLFMTNYPNPFRSTTTISYSLPEDGNVSLVVYNKLGQVVETLVSTRQEAGTYKVEFGRTDLTAGVYFYKIVVEGEATYTATNSMIIMQ